MADDRLPMMYCVGKRAARKDAFTIIRAHLESNERVLDKLYAMRLATIDWKWPFSRRRRRRFKLFHEACERLYWESKALSDVLLEILYNELTPA